MSDSGTVGQSYGVCKNLAKLKIFREIFLLMNRFSYIAKKKSRRFVVSSKCVALRWSSSTTPVLCPWTIKHTNFSAENLFLSFCKAGRRSMPAISFSSVLYKTKQRASWINRAFTPPESINGRGYTWNENLFQNTGFITWKKACIPADHHTRHTKRCYKKLALQNFYAQFGFGLTKL